MSHQPLEKIMYYSVGRNFSHPFYEAIVMNHGGFKIILTLLRKSSGINKTMMLTYQLFPT